MLVISFLILIHFGAQIVDGFQVCGRVCGACSHHRSHSATPLMVSAPRCNDRISHRSTFALAESAMSASLEDAEWLDEQKLEESLKRSSIKSKLFALSASCDRGFGASPADRSQIMEYVNELKNLIPYPIPTRGLTPSVVQSTESVPIEGVWKLVYTNALDVLSLAASPLTLLQGIYQVINRDGPSTNVIDLAPRVQALFPPSVVKTGSVLRLKVGTRAFARSDKRVGLSFQSVEAKPLYLLNYPVFDFLPSFKSVLPQAALVDAVVGGNSGEGPGYFDILYLDEDCLIIAQNEPGGIFVNVRTDKLPSE